MIATGSQELPKLLMYEVGFIAPFADKIDRKWFILLVSAVGIEPTTSD